MDNVGIVVEFPDAAIAFFAELGLELEGRATVEGEWAGRVTGLAPAVVGLRRYGSRWSPLAGTTREARARPGACGHESGAIRRSRAKRTDRGWTCLPGLVLPQCSLIARSVTVPASGVASLLRADERCRDNRPRTRPGRTGYQRLSGGTGTARAGLGGARTVAWR